MSQQDQKTEQPTARRLEKARRMGDFPVSRELVSALQFTIFATLLVRYSAEWFEQMRRMLRFLLMAAGTPPARPEQWFWLVGGLAGPFVRPLAGWALLVVVVVFSAHWLSTGGAVALSRLQPDLARLDPSSRLRQIPAQNLAQAAGAVLLIGFFAAVLFWLWQWAQRWSLWLPRAALAVSLGQVSSAIEWLLWRAMLMVGLLGALDMVRQRRRHYAQLRMTKQEVKDEAKESEGNPQIKNRLRRMMRDLSRRRMMDDVARATAVVVNPTHFAVAIRYAPVEMPAPKVVAKGKNYLAQRIRDRALRSQVPIVENPPLAQALYRSSQVGQEIPAHLYRAVAEVLAYIYRLMNGRLPSV